MTVAHADQAQARAFLAALTVDDAPGDRLSFRTFADNGEDRSVARTIPGDDYLALDELHALNKRGAGVFVTVQRTNGNGAKNEDVVAVRAVFTDLDGAPLGPVTECGADGASPHIVVETSPGRYHAYWRVADCSLAEFATLQKALARRFGGDDVHDLARVMRLPGFLHQKAEPFCSKLIEADATSQAYKVQQLVQSLGLQLEEAPTNIVRRIEEGARIAAGGRNAVLASFAGTMRRRGIGEEAISAALVVENSARCDPPLPQEEVLGIARSIARYPAATAATPLSPSTVTPLPGYTVAAIWEGFTPEPYLVKRLLGPRQLTVLFGESGHFKSAIALDLALCVATGMQFHGVKTRRAGVLYVAGEGHGGIKKRIRAWCLAHGLDASSEQPALYVTSAGASLINNAEQLRATVDVAATILGRPIELVVLDTWAANFGPGDPNHERDTSLAIDSAKCAAPDVAVLAIHHVGNTDKTRERGSSALKASADFRLQADYDEAAKLISLKWLKAKDDEPPEPIIFDWRAIPLDWVDEDGEELRSIVLERSQREGIHRPGPQSAGIGGNQEKALKSLQRLYARNRANLQVGGRDPNEARIFVDGWRRDCEKLDIDRRRWPEVLDGLVKRGLVRIDGVYVELAGVVA